MKIGIDIMGGDFAPQVTIAGSVLAKKELPSEFKIIMIGDEKVIRAELLSKNISESEFEIIHAADTIEMGEHPTKAFAQKPNSSINIGFKLLKEGKIDSFASAGNSGAMLVGSMLTVKTIPGVIRPTVATVLPKESGGVGVLLDAGINADCKPDVLYQFGIIGSLYSQHVHKIKNPKVGLLNIGEESEKGNLVVQAAHNMMRESDDFNFVGNVEGRDVFSDKTDVIVCEGFTGNIVLKLSEAFYTIIRKRKLGDEYFGRFNYENYGGLPILGINAAVVIGHGISNDIAIKNMILLSKDVIEADLSSKIKQTFQ